MSESEVGYVLSIPPMQNVVLLYICKCFLEWHAREGESPVTNKKGVLQHNVVRVQKQAKSSLAVVLRKSGTNE